MFIRCRLFYSRSNERDNRDKIGGENVNETVNISTSATSFSNQATCSINSACDQSDALQKSAQLTYKQYECMSSDEKNRLHNRVRQWALKARECLSNEHGLFCLVVSHLLRNAHRYFNIDKQSKMQCKILEQHTTSDEMKEKCVEMFKEANKKLREAGDLKGMNRITEQQKVVAELKQSYHSFRNMAFVSGISLKTVHSWCSLPKEKTHKSTELARKWKAEYEKFLLQDSISFAHPCKKLAKKRFVRDTLAVTREKYL